MKIEPVYEPLPDTPASTRIFSNWFPFGPNKTLRMELGATNDIGTVTALFVIEYNRHPSEETEEVILNGHTMRIPLSAARAIRCAIDNHTIIQGLTSGWTAWFWMDCISINESDQAEAEKQRRLEPFIHAIAKWTLDCTGPVAQVRLGNNAYQSAVVNFGGVADNFRALEESLDNLGRLRGHTPGRVIWTANH